MDGNHDKTKVKDDYEWGWNDPPSLSYNECTSATNKRPPPNLQQRVYHSTNETVGSSQVTPHQGTTPTLNSAMAPPTGNYLGHTPSATKPTLNERDSVKAEEGPVCESTEGPRLDFIVLQLETTLGEHKDSLPGRVVEDVQKKLSIFSHQWTDKKLSDKVQSKMHSLAQAMSEKDFSKAHEMHVSLIVDHSGEVSQWMVGIKKIISIAMQKK